MAAINKQIILAQIKKTAAENGGVPLGVRRFETATGIRQSDWRGVYWTKWSDAVREVGLDLATEFTKSYDDIYLLNCIVKLIREKGRFPVEAEVMLRARDDKSFPNATTFRRFGRKHQLAARVLAYAKEQPGHDDVVAICEPIALAIAREPVPDDEADAEAVQFGEVYLLKSGRYFKIGRTNSVGRRERELAIQLPEKATLVHSIRTDDPTGIEAYWHRRFADRRQNGEWFELSPQDVSAFRRRKGFM